MQQALPSDANEFIEQQLDRRLAAIQDEFGADALGFSGSLYFGVDDLLRSTVEALVSTAKYDRRLAVVLTSSGGYIEVVQRVVDVLRYHFDHVAFIVPNYAFSAGTVLAMSGDEIHMDYFSRLGPIDPQVERTGGRNVPALGYLEQWDRLIEKAKKGTLTMAEVQLMIDGFDQAELYAYEQARELSVSLLKDWLVRYKFKNWLKTKTRGMKVTPAMRSRRAAAIARQLNNTKKWHIHGHGISREVLERDLKLQIDDLDSKPPVCTKVKEYHSLLSDYMAKRGVRGVLHTAGRYVPYDRDR